MGLRSGDREAGGGGGPGHAGRIMLGAVRLASLPFFLAAILLMASLYGAAILARRLAPLAALGKARCRGLGRACGHR